MPAGRPTKYCNHKDFYGVSGIYALHCPFSGEIRYVGRSKDIGKRLSKHLSLSTKDNTYYGNWIRSLTEKPLTSVLELTDNTASREIYWIKAMRNSGARLVNTGAGGEGAPDDSVFKLTSAVKKMFRGSKNIKILCDQVKQKYNQSSEHERILMQGHAQRLLPKV